MNFKPEQNVIHSWYYRKNFPDVVAAAIPKTVKAN